MALALFFILSAKAHAAIFAVDSNLDVVDALPGDGLCATASATCTLRAAIQEANSSPGFDEIRLPPNSYLLNLSGGVVDDTAVSGDLDILEPVWIRADPKTLGSPFNVQISDQSFILHTNQGERVFDINTGNSSTPVRFENLTIGFGKAHDALGGGAVLVRASSTVLLERSVLYANGADTRGNALAVYGTAVMRESRVFDNHRSWNSLPGEGGGAFYVADGASLLLSDVALDSNSHCSGGAVLALGNSVVSIVRSTIHSNPAGACDAFAWNVKPRRDSSAVSPDRRDSSAVSPDRRDSASIGGEFTFDGTGILNIDDSTLMPSGQLLDARGGAQIDLNHVTIAGPFASAVELHDLNTRLRIGNSVWAVSTEMSPCNVPVGTVVSLGGNVFMQSPVCDVALASGDVSVNSLALEEVSIELPGADMHLFAVSPVRRDLFAVSPVRRDLFAVSPVRRDLFTRKAFAPKRGSAAIDNGRTGLCSAVDETDTARPVAASALTPARCDSGAIEWPPTSLLLNGFE